MLIFSTETDDERTWVGKIGLPCTCRGDLGVIRNRIQNLTYNDSP